MRSPSVYQYIEVDGSGEKGALGGTQVKDAVQDTNFKYAGWDLHPSGLVAEGPQLLQKDLQGNKLHLSFSNIGDAGRSLCTNISRCLAFIGVVACVDVNYKDDRVYARILSTFAVMTR